MIKKSKIVHKLGGQNFFYILFLLVIFGCSSGKQIEIKTADELFRLAKEKYDEGNFDEASKYFDLLKLQYPASQYSDDAQFYLAEINFKRGEYIMAVFNYNWLRRSYSNSPFYKESLYKTALCYYYLSPPFDRDQEYTHKAIEAFTDFKMAYPQDTLTIRVDEYLNELKNKLAYRNYFTALLYYKMQSFRSSLIYLDEVIDKYSDSLYIEDAYWLKANILKNLNRLLDLKDVVEEYQLKFPNGRYYKELLSLLNQTKW
ncbi:MAG: outer membrane protein assembly factor BamD [Candidatus Kapaibacteriales bacterium]